MPKVEIIKTKDGSSSLFLPDMNETYHSTHGALTEALYVFIDKALEEHRRCYPNQETIKILEIGFGTGLNAWLTASKVLDSNFTVEYCSLEKFPVGSEIVSELNYTDNSPIGDKELFEKLHDAAWNVPVSVTDNFVLEKLETDVFDFETRNDQFDIIYFDAFAPSKQPEMWSLEVLNKMYSSTAKGGIFSTYCAQGQFKRDLRAAGYDTESLPGPPGKKEMTRGRKV
ncbi:tRNA (5-methylaminomethyl-2-thiouridine)(34)-methyltransferase MnmD [Reichenbachiella versicolor]|uniref:tRNA (5-methylaminomethyl-2-thiouridine)(34)-methyltransferase MnmD n=1 Tax=Reichenbachiella versicolor TaxID=1821036 RepID=UPI000D6E5181|nr:tRNA (5-methylaminomethyl-2-thiouridine)(34)-methyltransferase MnmD [Reichenbachiella versicolor]